MNSFKYVLLVVIAFLLVQGCGHKCKIDYNFLGVEDDFCLECTDKLDEVSGVDVLMYSKKLKPNLTMTYTFFSNKLYSKSWIYFVGEVDTLKKHLPKNVLCKTHNCDERLKQGEVVLLWNFNNNQYYTCKLDYEKGEPNLRFNYLFKFIK